MEMHQVRYFLAVSRTLNFTRAAEECNVAQPSLTKAIQKLEEELGGLLFRRERGLTHLTDLGRLMLPHLEQTYAAAQAARALAEGMRKAEVAPLRLGVTDSIFLVGLHELMGELGRALKGLQLQVSHGPQAAMVETALHGDLDLVIVNAMEDLPDRLRLKPLLVESPVLLVASDNPLARSGAVPLETLAEQPWIGRPGCPVAEGFLAICRSRGIGPDIRHQGGSEFSVQQMVRAGMGVALGWEGSPRLPGLLALPLAEPGLGRTVALASVSGRQFSPAADAFLRLARSRDWQAREEPAAA